MSKKLRMKRSLDSTSAAGTLPQITMPDIKETSLKLNLFPHAILRWYFWPGQMFFNSVQFHCPPILLFIGAAIIGNYSHLLDIAKAFIFFHLNTIDDSLHIYTNVDITR